MSSKLLNISMNDGSRQFATLPETYSVSQPQWERLRDHVEQLPGAVLADFVTDSVTEAWIDFEYRGHHFSINNQLGEWWFSVSNPCCPEGILKEIIIHFEALLGS